jgi:hypothetical protein
VTALERTDQVDVEDRVEVGGKRGGNDVDKGWGEGGR